MRLVSGALALLFLFWGFKVFICWDQTVSQLDTFLVDWNLMWSDLSFAFIEQVSEFLTGKISLFLALGSCFLVLGGVSFLCNVQAKIGGVLLLFVLVVKTFFLFPSPLEIRAHWDSSIPLFLMHLIFLVTVTYLTSEFWKKDY